MFTCELEKLAYEYEQSEKEIINILIAGNGLISKWEKDNQSYYILSRCAKRSGFQLTLFRNDMPQFHMIRNTCCDKDFIDELVINECTLNISKNKIA